MYVIRLIVIGIVFMGVLAGIGALTEADNQTGQSGGDLSDAGITLLFIVGGLVGVKLLASMLGPKNSSHDTIYHEGNPKDRPPFKILQEGTDHKGRPYYVIQGDADDAKKLTAGWTYPGDVSWVHEHKGHYKWLIHVEDWNTQGIRQGFNDPTGKG